MPPPTLEGFYYYFVKHGTGGQHDIFKFALGRLARKAPNADPRRALLEYFAEHISGYENHLYRINNEGVRVGNSTLGKGEGRINHILRSK